MQLAIVMPVLNEAPQIEATLLRLNHLRARGARVIVVDGGSQDDTVTRAAPLADRTLVAPRGRSLQMNAGARADEAAGADVLLFLHADTQLPAEADRLIFRSLANSTRCWGRFDLAFAPATPLLSLVATMINLRSRATGVATGDQAIFVSRGAFLALQGFAPIALMEDIEFSQRARHLSPPLALRARVITSPRRWQQRGVWRTIFLMWRLRLAYFLGADPDDLARRYRDVR